MVGYGAPNDTQDGCMCMAESTAHVCMYRFCRAVVVVFGELYLPSPTIEDTARIMATNALREFPRIPGNIDCMRWHRKNYLFSWQGMYKVANEVAS
jgi:hypothetical protein